MYKNVTFATACLTKSVWLDHLKKNLIFRSWHKLFCCCFSQEFRNHWWGSGFSRCRRCLFSIDVSQIMLFLYHLIYWLFTHFLYFSWYSPFLNKRFYCIFVEYLTSRRKIIIFVSFSLNKYSVGSSLSYNSCRLPTYACLDAFEIWLFFLFIFIF